MTCEHPGENELHGGIPDIYEKHAAAWDAHRTRVFFEKDWLDNFIERLPPSGRVLDLECGAAEPIGAHLTCETAVRAAVCSRQRLLER